MSRPEPPISVSVIDRKTILIAEDFRENAELMGRLLEMDGYHVIIAKEGGEAVEKALEVIPDIIILDISMPVMTGFEACAELKRNERTRHIPIIFISAHDGKEFKDEGLRLGAIRYFTKPVDMEEVETFISHILGAANEEEHERDVPTPEAIAKAKTKDPFRICGTVLDSRYELIEFAGSGGMGAVYRALNLADGNIVAVKILQPHIVARSPEYADLFEREVQHAQGLDHPHIVRIYDSGKDEDLSYMVMEWVEGHSVEDEIARGLLSLERITSLFGQICDAVEYAHQKGIIHLDLKPSNLLLLRDAKSDDFIKVIDFGLSRVINKESGTTVTKFRGTHQYCAPEQFAGKVSHRSDIYSLGATLYHLITGVIPFGTSYINAKMHPNLDLPEVPSVTRQRDVPSQLDFVIKKALDKSPYLRQQSVSELFEEFSAALTAGVQESENTIPSMASSLERKQKSTKSDSSYVRRDAQGRFYESDDIGRPLNLDAEGHKKKEIRKTTKRDWNNPQVACSLLSTISGLQTGGYKSTGVEDDFFCCSPYKDLDQDSPLSNNIAYYAEGGAEEVNRLKLVLNVHDPEKAEAAHRALMIYCNELACKALGEELSPKMQEAILAGHPEAYTAEGLFVELRREAWVTGRGYELKFIITQPINISSPLKATESQEETKPIPLPNFIESDSKVDSPARLSTSNLDYEPDETAKSMLAFLAKPQHRTVYAVEIGNALGLAQALVKSYVDKLAEEDYVVITRDDRTNSDVCTITQKGKKFLDKPVSETVNNRIEAVLERVEATRESDEKIADSLSDFEVEILSLFEGHQLLTVTEVLKRFPHIDGKRTRHTLKQLINKRLLESRNSVIHLKE